MSYYRDLTNAQSDLNEAAEILVRTGRAGHRLSSEPYDFQEAYEGLCNAWDAWEALAAQADNEGAASARHTSIAASKDLSVMSTWRGKVQRAVWTRGKVVAVGGDSTHFVNGVTCDDLERTLGSYGHSAPHQSISSAVNWAEKTGWIRDSGYTRETRQGRQAIVYEPTDKLIEKMAEERRVG